MPSCAVCGTEAPSEKHLRQHIKSKHDDRVLKCEECDVTCKGAMKLKMHKNIHRVVSCKNCDKVIPYNSSSSHKIMCGGDKKEFKCENCPAKLNKALGYNTTLIAGQSKGWYVLILVPKKLEDFETFNAVLQRGAPLCKCLALIQGFGQCKIRTYQPSNWPANKVML